MTLRARLSGDLYKRAVSEIAFKGEKGDRGNGIVSIVLTSSSGVYDTYTITYDDGETSEFTVKNGEAATLDLGTVTTGEPGTDAYAVNVGTDTHAVINFTIPRGDKGETGDKGDTGKGVVSIVRTSGNGAPGTTDTYTITYSDSTTSTFSVYHGADGEDGQSATIAIGSVTTGDSGTNAEVTNTGTSSAAVFNFRIPRGADGNDGRGIASVERTSGNGAPGTTDTYTITFTDSTTATFAVYNGANGVKGDPGKGLTILGYYASASSLSSVDNPQVGDCYGIGSAPFDYYIYNGSSWDNHGKLQGAKGDTGVGIASIARTSGNGAAGTTDTYTITFTDDTTTTFTVYNGADGQAGAKGDAGDAATIAVGTVTTASPGSNAEVTNVGTSNAAVLNFKIPRGADGQAGADGRGIVSFSRTSGDGAPGTTDTYTLTFTDDTTATVQVYNGANGAKGDNGDKGDKGDKGDTGRGISSITRTSGNGAPGTFDTYTISFTDSTNTTFQVYNGANGTDASVTKAAVEAVLTGLITSHTHNPDSTKADKVSGATSGNFAALDSSGNLTDSGKKASDFATLSHTHSTYVPNTREINGKALSSDITLSASDVGADASGAASSAVSAHNSDNNSHSSLFGNKADKVSSATAGNFASLDANGNLTDSGHKDSDYADAEHDHTVADITDIAANYIPVTAKGAVNGVASLGSDGKVPSEQLPSSGAATFATYTATIGTTWSGSAAPYSQTINITGLLATDKPVIDIVQTGTEATDSVMRENWGKITRITTANGSITVYASEALTGTIPIQLLCWR